MIFSVAGNAIFLGIKKFLANQSLTSLMSQAKNHASEKFSRKTTFIYFFI
jgi:hypothetical protein